MFRLIILSITQAILMCSAQSLFKVAAEHMGSFSWTWVFFRDGVLTNWWLIASGLCGIIGTLEWMYMLRSFPFSQVYFKRPAVSGFPRSRISVSISEFCGSGAASSSACSWQ